MRTFYSIRNKREAEDLKEALVTLLTGYEYLWAKTEQGSVEMDIHLGHYLDAEGTTSKQAIWVSESPDTGDITLYIHDTYGLHWISNEDERTHVHINWGRGEISIYDYYKSAFSGEIRSLKIFRVTGKLSENIETDVRVVA